MFRVRLRTARDVYGLHPDDLSPEQQDRLWDFVALEILEPRVAL